MCKAGKWAIKNCNHAFHNHFICILNENFRLRWIYNAVIISFFFLQFKQFKDKLWQGFGRGESVEERPKTVVVVVECLVFVVFFSSIFLLIPAAIFTALENDDSGKWDYSDSVYYTFITLSTIGFGDMVPGTGNEKGN